MKLDRERRWGGVHFYGNLTSARVSARLNTGGRAGGGRDEDVKISDGRDEDGQKWE